MPERIRGSVRPQRVGKHISEASSMKHGIAPQGQGSTRVGEQAASGRGDETKSALSNTVLLRRVGKGKLVLDAKFCTGGLDPRIDKLAATVGVEDMEGATVLHTGLPNPGIDEGRSLSLGAQEVGGSIARVVIDKQESIAMTLTRRSGMWTPYIEMNKQQWRISHRGSGGMWGFTHLALDTRRTGRARTNRGRRKSSREVSKEASGGDFANHTKAWVTQPEVMQHCGMGKRATRAGGQRGEGDRLLGGDRSGHLRGGLNRGRGEGEGVKVQAIEPERGKRSARGARVEIAMGGTTREDAGDAISLELPNRQEIVAVGGDVEATDRT